MHDNVDVPLPPGVQRLETKAAILSFSTWRRNIARGHVPVPFADEHNASSMKDPSSEIHENIIVPNYSSDHDRSQFELLQKFLAYTNEAKVADFKKRSREQSSNSEEDHLSKEFRSNHYEFSDISQISATTTPQSSSSASSSSSTSVACHNCNLINSGSSSVCSFCRTDLSIEHEAFNF